jgi:oligopeptide/dipeptide ABC transporter ATP-binding protein
MYAGEIVEQTDTPSLFRDPRHPYTKGLIASIPMLGSPIDELNVIPGSVPNLIALPEGCRFAPRCAARVAHGNVLATQAHPELLPLNGEPDVRCWLYHRQDGSLRPTVDDFSEVRVPA